MTSNSGSSDTCFSVSSMKTYRGRKSERYKRNRRERLKQKTQSEPSFGARELTEAELEIEDSKRAAKVEIAFGIRPTNFQPSINIVEQGVEVESHRVVTEQPSNTRPASPTPQISDIVRNAYQLALSDECYHKKMLSNHFINSNK